MAERVKVYEEGKKGFPTWVWLLPVLLLSALLAYFLLNRHADQPAVASAPVATGAYPDLGTVHFETDKASLTQEGQGTLDRAAEAMKANPAAHLRLEGYTDSTGSDAHNQSLSQQRASTVADYLKSKGIDSSRLTGGGFAAGNPVDTNATASGKADNRRVELFSQQ